MVELQLIAKIIATGDFSIIEQNAITEDYFKRTDNKDETTKDYVNEFRFIKDHYDKYGNVPDKETFVAKFPEYKDGGLPAVNESDSFLVDAIREQYTFNQGLPILKRAAEIFSEDANAGVEYMLNALKSVQINYQLGGTDIVSHAEERFEHLKDRLDNPNKWYISSGFRELDNVTNGIRALGEELVVILARTNQGKSWILEKMLVHIWRQGFDVGYISPEMGPDSIGFRFDTLYKGFSNSDLVRGRINDNLVEYEQYIQELKDKENKFLVATPSADFNNRVTISKLRQWVKQNNLKALAIDGITYLSDERGRRNDNKTTTLTNISEDLMSLSVELQIPIFVVVQANRNGVVDKDSDGTPELESIRDSDGIAHNATKVISLRQKDGVLDMGLIKNRDGIVNVHFKYLWNINIGEFVHIDGEENITEEERVERRERKKEIGKDIF